MQEETGRPLHVDTITGPVLIVAADTSKAIPEGKAIVCPQCDERAWAESRFCKNCGWDFDRTKGRRMKTANLLVISASLNVITAAILLWEVCQGFLR